MSCTMAQRQQIKMSKHRRSGVERHADVAGLLEWNQPSQRSASLESEPAHFSSTSVDTDNSGENQTNGHC